MDVYDTNAITMTKFKPKDYQQVRLENAMDAWKIHKSIYLDQVTCEPLPGYKAWTEFRDEFLIDWKSNRRLVTEKEADVIFDKLADESLSELENIGAAADENVLDDDTIGVIVENPVTGEPIAVTTPVVAKRVRKLKLVTTPTGLEVLVPKASKKVVVKAKKPGKVAAKKVKLSDRAESVIIRFVNAAWSRKEIIEKLMKQFDITSANAGYYYQKFSK